jgi:hypothetical protein
MVNLHSYFVFETHDFHWIITIFITCFHILFPLAFCAYYFHIVLHNYKKSHKFIQFMIYERKKKWEIEYHA